jgi:hypothetical protein
MCLRYDTYFASLIQLPVALQVLWCSPGCPFRCCTRPSCTLHCASLCGSPTKIGCKPSGKLTAVSRTLLTHTCYLCTSYHSLICHSLIGGKLPEWPIIWAIGFTSRLKMFRMCIYSKFIYWLCKSLWLYSAQPFEKVRTFQQAYLLETLHNLSYENNRNA